MEDELLNFLVIKIKTSSQEEIVFLAMNTFDSEGTEATTNVLFGLCPASQWSVGYKDSKKLSTILDPALRC